MPEFISILRWIRDVVYPKVTEIKENLDIVAENIDDVNTNANNIESIKTSATIKVNIVSVSENIEKINNVSENIERIAEASDFAYRTDLIVPVETIEQMLSLTPLDKDIAMVKDLNRGGTFIYDVTQAAINNDGTIFDGWVRQYSGAVNVKWFGAKGDGIADDTNTLQLALVYCNAKRINLYIPSGKYMVKDNIGFPNKIKVYGDGMSTFIYADMVSGKWVFETTSNVNGYTIENMQFYAVNERNIGCIKADYGLRGCSINNIWSFDMEKILYIGDLVYGTIDISNIFGYYLRTERSTNKAIDIYGNTVFMKNIELIGAWEYGLYANSSSVFSLRDFNIGGSSTTIQMKRAVYLDTCKFGTIETGWIEQLDDVFWANGIAEAIYCKNTSSVSVNNINIASGSLYSDNSNITCTGIKYAQVNGGLKYINGGEITTTKDSIKSFSINHSDGECRVIDITSTSNTPIVSNPMLLQGAYDPDIIFGATNDALVALSRDTTDYVTGESSIKATVATAFHGVRIRALSLKAGNEYTVSILAKASVGKLVLAISSGSTTNPSKKPSSVNRSDKTGVFGIYTYGVTAGVDGRIDLKLISDAPCVILIDSIQIYGGYKVEDLYALNNDTSDNLVADNAPTVGTWEKGQILKSTKPTASGFIGWVCTVSGTPGTWKTFGAISE